MTELRVGLCLAAMLASVALAGYGSADERTTSAERSSPTEVLSDSPPIDSISGDPSETGAAKDRVGISLLSLTS